MNWVLVDTAVWIDFFRAGQPELAGLLRDGRVLVHDMIIGELALGNAGQREQALELLYQLPTAQTVSHAHVMLAVQTNALHGRGVGYVDAHLLTAARITPNTKLWSADKRLMACARLMGVDHLAVLH